MNISNKKGQHNYLASILIAMNRFKPSGGFFLLLLQTNLLFLNFFETKSSIPLFCGLFQQINYES